MFGIFQRSQIRIEIQGTQQQIREALVQPQNWPHWLWFQSGFPQQLMAGSTFTTRLGAIPVQHQVESLTANQMRFVLSQGIDGFHDWCWGDGWVQSHLEGISVLPLNLGQTLTLAQLRRYVEHGRR
jgi:hypothetical protein